MESCIGFGNYNLLDRIANGENLIVPEWSILFTDGLVFENPDGSMGISKAGLKELKKERPAFPKLGRSEETPTCQRCGAARPLTLCTGDGN